MLKTLRKSGFCIRCGLPTHASSDYKAILACQPPVRHESILDLPTELLRITLEDYICDQPTLEQHHPTIADQTLDIIRKVIVSGQLKETACWQHAALFMDSRIAAIYAEVIQNHLLHVFDIDSLLLATSAHHLSGMAAPNRLPIKALRIRVNIKLKQNALGRGSGVAGVVAVTNAQIAPLLAFLCSFTDAQKFMVKLSGVPFALQSGGTFNQDSQTMITAIRTALMQNPNLQRMSVGTAAGARWENVAGGVAVVSTSQGELARHHAQFCQRFTKLTKQKVANRVLEEQLEGAVARTMKMYSLKHCSTRHRFRTCNTEPHISLGSSCGRQIGPFRKGGWNGTQTVKTGVMTQSKPGDEMEIPAIEYRRLTCQKEPVYRTLQMRVET